MHFKHTVSLAVLISVAAAAPVATQAEVAKRGTYEPESFTPHYGRVMIDVVENKEKREAWDYGIDLKPVAPAPEKREAWNYGFDLKPVTPAPEKRWDYGYDLKPVTPAPEKRAAWNYGFDLKPVAPTPKKRDAVKSEYNFVHEARSGGPPTYGRNKIQVVE